jgi:hypothetical protein
VTPGSLLLCSRVVQDDTWEVVNADQTIEALQAELLAKTLAVVSDAAATFLKKLWTSELE